jgi:hypothetical protein
VTENNVDKFHFGILSAYPLRIVFDVSASAMMLQTHNLSCKYFNNNNNRKKEKKKAERPKKRKKRQRENEYKKVTTIVDRKERKFSSSL